MLAKRSDRDSLRVQVFQELEERILSGEFHEGDMLNELKLSEELGVSRTPIREAIGKLEQEGLIQIIPNRGAAVVGVSGKDMEDIYTIRTHIEGLAARWTARNITDSEFRQLKDILDLQRFYLQRQDMEKVWEKDGEFHEMIHRLCKSNLLSKMLTSMHHYIARARKKTIENADRAEASVREHEAILNAIERRDEEASEKAMTDHIINAKNSFLSMIQ